jgi:hypothetical protein
MTISGGHLGFPLASVSIFPITYIPNTIIIRQHLQLVEYATNVYRRRVCSGGRGIATVNYSSSYNMSTQNVTNQYARYTILQYITTNLHKFVKCCMIWNYVCGRCVWVRAYVRASAYVSWENEYCFRPPLCTSGCTYHGRNEGMAEHSLITGLYDKHLHLRIWL